MQQSLIDANETAGPIVDIAWLRSRQGSPGLRIVDARPYGHYLMGHIPHAVSLDVNTIRMAASSPSGIAALVDQGRSELRRIGVGPNERIVFYEDFSGAAAARGVWMLDVLGHRGGVMLDGGLHAWMEAGGTLTREEPNVEASEFDVALDQSVLATAEEIREALATDARLSVVDTRNDLEFRAGTIPGAIHLEWLHHLRPDGTLRPLSELRDLYNDLGLASSDWTPVVTFCGSGYRAAHTYIVLKLLGFPSSRTTHPPGENGEDGGICQLRFRRADSR